MQINTHFNYIENIIYNNILKSRSSIKIAMCYFTNEKIIKLLSNKTFLGVDVEIIIDIESKIDGNYQETYKTHNRVFAINKFSLL